MKSTSKVIMLAAISGAILCGALVSSPQLAVAGEGNGRMNNNDNDNMQNEHPDTVIPLKEAKLNIEHNAKDNDTGFQGFIDSEGWKKITATGPDGKVLQFQGKGSWENLD